MTGKQGEGGRKEVDDGKTRRRMKRKEVDDGKARRRREKGG